MNRTDGRISPPFPHSWWCFTAMKKSGPEPMSATYPRSTLGEPSLGKSLRPPETLPCTRAYVA